MNNKQHDFLTLIEPLKGPLIGLSRHLLWDKNDVEDAVQNTLAEAYRRFDQFEAGTNFKAWLFKVASLTIFNMNRKHQRQKSGGMDLLESHASKESTPEGPDIPWKNIREHGKRSMDEISDRMKSSLEDLKQNEREVFSLRTLGGLSYAEISETLEMPMGSVMGHLSRARSKMKAALYDHAKKEGWIK